MNKFFSFLGFTGIRRFEKGWLIFRKGNIWWFGPKKKIDGIGG